MGLRGSKLGNSYLYGENSLIYDKNFWINNENSLKNGKNSLINDDNLWLNGVNLGSDVEYPSSNGAYPKPIGESTVIDIRHRCNRTRFSKHLQFSIYEDIQCI
jgi:hypothetical protein